MGEPRRAVELAREAHSVLNEPATACRLAQSLLYLQEFGEAEQLLRTAITDVDHKTTLIARTQLVSLAKRRVEELNKQRQMGQAIEIGSLMLRETGAYLDTGVADHRLRAKALELASDIIQVGGYTPDIAVSAPQLGAAVSYGAARIHELLVSPKKAYWLQNCQRLQSREDCPDDLGSALDTLTRQLDVGAGSDAVTGRIYSYDAEKGYGFIDQPDVEDRIFFHRENLFDASAAILMVPGTPVSFSVRHDERGLRADRGRPTLAPESQSERMTRRADA